MWHKAPHLFRRVKSCALNSIPSRRDKFLNDLRRYKPPDVGRSVTLSGGWTRLLRRPPVIVGVRYSVRVTSLRVQISDMGSFSGKRYWSFMSRNLWIVTRARSSWSEFCAVPLIDLWCFLTKPIGLCRLVQIENYIDLKENICDFLLHVIQPTQLVLRFRLIGRCPLADSISHRAATLEGA
ncbi:hypothetical protein EVAR_102651_1 [Eumeta japonica]|uniref:Uncharacterized protein n=1 Tax=Eumeta variegata TaxID=151549 RepID=A0A4C1TUU2_EUMVA|nr:hypothetical protein EVAR_102651_1 [Eumeta japonica]